MAFAACHHPTLLVAVLWWLAGNVAADVALGLVLYPVLLRAWRRMSPHERSRLLKLRDRFFPPAEDGG